MLMKLGKCYGTFVLLGTSAQSQIACSLDLEASLIILLL